MLSEPLRDLQLAQPTVESQIGENVIAVGGQGSGADTAIVLKSANTTRFFDLDIQEIIAKTINKKLERQ